MNLNYAIEVARDVRRTSAPVAQVLGGPDGYLVSFALGPQDDPFTNLSVYVPSNDDRAHAVAPGEYAQLARHMEPY